MEILIAVAVLLILGIGAALARTIARDGLGHRPPPPDRHPTLHRW